MKIGVSGHQELEHPHWVKSQILQILRQEKKAIVGVSSLAIGADQIFAQAIVDCGGTLEIIIPHKGYEHSFEKDGREEYQRLLNLASSVQEIPVCRSKEEAYFTAGKRVVDLSDLLITVWNEKPAAGLGGTADVVQYAQQQRKNYILINPETTEVRRYIV